MVDVFISYKQEEREAVQIIASTLNDLRLSVWFDTKLRAGGSFDEEIAAALVAAKAVLVCWTPAAIQSEWVRSESTQGMQTNRLAACFLQPTQLIPPFNLVHAENLCAWAGQADDPPWVKLLERIGELVGRPGLSTYARVMRPGVSIEELRAWAEANGADPLADSVWTRLALLEGEGAAERLARERAEARMLGERRKALTEKSRRLTRERGLRDPAAERRRFVFLVGAVVAIAVLSIGAIVYFVDAQDRERRLQEANSVLTVREFIATNAWHPIISRAREKLARLDLDAWSNASDEGTIAALQAYVEGASSDPRGAFIVQADEMLSVAEETRQVQELLSRLLIYRGPIDGAKNDITNLAIRVFRYRCNMVVSDDIDETLKQRLAAALEVWIHPRLEDLRAVTRDRPSESDFVRLAAEFGIEGAVLQAVAEVESGSFGAFGEDGRPTLFFERHLFSRKTNGRYDATHPRVSNRTPGGYPRVQAQMWDRLAEAHALDPEAALESASWGSVQLLGQNFGNSGFENVGEYVRFLSQSEINQYEALLRMVRANRLIDELQRHDWVGFAARYNGPGYVANRYHTKLAEVYERIRTRMAAEYGVSARD